MTNSDLVLSGGDHATSSLTMRSSLSRGPNPACHLRFHSGQQSHLYNKRKHKELVSRDDHFNFCLCGLQSIKLTFSGFRSPTPKIQEQEEPGWIYFLLLRMGVSHTLI